MTRRIPAIVAAIALTWVLAGPAVAAGATHLRVQGSGVTAFFSSSAGLDPIPPGDYFGAVLGAGSSIGRGDGAFENNSLCLGIDETRLDADFGWSLERSYSTCGEIDGLSVRGDLGSAHLVASFAATCEEYRGPTWACGQMDIDLTLTGVGPLTTYHETTVSGEPGAGGGRSVIEASGASRSAVYASGHVTLGDRSFTLDAVLTDAWIFDLKRGTVTIGG